MCPSAILAQCALTEGFQLLVAAVSFAPARFAQIESYQTTLKPNPNKMLNYGTLIFNRVRYQSVSLNFYFWKEHYKNGHPYWVNSGTSFACPYACAVAAHVLVAMETQRYNDFITKGSSEGNAQAAG